jgi:hypothetical protein
MTSLKSGLCWGAAIVLNAAGNRFGLIDDKTAETLFIVLPIVAVFSLGRGCECGWWRRAGEA